MKKTLKTTSLTLCRETLRMLTAPLLAEVAGGAVPTNNPNVSICGCNSKPGRCTTVGTDFCDPNVPTDFC